MDNRICKIASVIRQLVRLRPHLSYTFVLQCFVLCFSRSGAWKQFIRSTDCEELVGRSRASFYRGRQVAAKNFAPIYKGKSGFDVVEAVDEIAECWRAHREAMKDSGNAQEQAAMLLWRCWSRDKDDFVAMGFEFELWFWGLLFALCMILICAVGACWRLDWDVFVTERFELWWAIIGDFEPLFGDFVEEWKVPPRLF